MQKKTPFYNNAITNQKTNQNKHKSLSERHYLFIILKSIIKQYFDCP